LQILAWVLVDGLCQLAHKDLTQDLFAKYIGTLLVIVGIGRIPSTEHNMLGVLILAAISVTQPHLLGIITTVFKIGKTMLDSFVLLDVLN
jgi:hypothetical protein